MSALHILIAAGSRGATAMEPFSMRAHLLAAATTLVFAVLLTMWAERRRRARGRARGAVRRDGVQGTDVRDQDASVQRSTQGDRGAAASSPLPRVRSTRDDSESRWVYLAVGAMAAIALGLALAPLRDLTSASNFAFAFVLLTIVVAEMGGGAAGLGTALLSALSLNFFLTQPYMRLAIDDKHDLVAFAGLAVCALVAAAFGARRSERTARLRETRRQLDVLHLALQQMGKAGELEPEIAKILEAVRRAFPHAAAAVRDSRGYVVAATEGAHGRDVPDEAGTRLPLVFENRQVGWLDLWDDETAANTQSRRTLLDVACVVAVRLGRAASPDVDRAADSAPNRVGPGPSAHDARPRP